MKNNVELTRILNRRMQGSQEVSFSIQSFQWFDKALTGEEVKALYERGRDNKNSEESR